MKRDLALLRGRHILIVEVEHFLDDQTRRAFDNCGVVVVGPVQSVDRALDLLGEARVDAAILDIELGSERVYPLADLLVRRGVPFIFATSDETSAISRHYRGFVLCENPVELAVIALALFAT